MSREAEAGPKPRGRPCKDGAATAPETFGSLALIQSIFEENCWLDVLVAIAARRASINLTVFGIFNTYLWRSFGRRMGSRTRRIEKLEVSGAIGGSGFQKRDAIWISMAQSEDFPGKDRGCGG